MYDAGRHTALLDSAWDAVAARAAIQEIVREAESAFDPERFWPSHPLDEHVPDGTTGLYFGAAGVIWAMDYLRREGAAEHGLDFAPILPRLLEANRAEFKIWEAVFKFEPHRASLFMGDPAVLLLMTGAGAAGAADDLHRRIEESIDLPVLELMWGAAGTMLACVFAAEMTGQDRWRTLYLALAERLLADLRESDHGPIWTQDLYGEIRQFLGPVHGFAGNMQALMRGWPWLSDAQRARIVTAIPRTLEANVRRSDMGANWPAVVADESGSELVQYCHGAPGVVTVFADPVVAGPALAPLLEAGGALAWNAGPLAKGWTLCHGTGGNGYAFLKLHDLTGDAIWLDRARAFAMTAIAQCRAARTEYGRARFSLWTGDVGLAVYLYDCLSGVPRFPTTDVF